MRLISTRAPDGGVKDAGEVVLPTSFPTRRLRIVMIGAGISGIQIAKDVSTRMQNYELDIYEKNPGVGGTWFENRYPGCACDVPSHTYQFSWEPNPHWSKFYSPAPEILEYLNFVVDKHDLRKFMHFNHRARHSEWNESTSTWRVDLEITDAAGKVTSITKECEVLIQGLGTLNNFKYPDIEGLGSFRGDLMHTANWDSSKDLTGQKVAVIGNGASAVQVVAEIQPGAGKVFNYIRTATWMLPHIFSDGAVQQDYPEGFRDKIISDPEFYKEYRRDLEVRLAAGFESLWRGSKAQHVLEAVCREHVKAKIKDPKLQAAMIPDFEIGCRRFTPGDHYLHALQQENTEMISDRIVRVTPVGIEDANGTVREADTIICATGFETSFEPRFPVIGRDGYSLAENWGMDKPRESYMGATVARFPNFFTINPPITPVLGSAFPGIAAASDFVMRVIDRLQHDCLKSVCVKQQAQTDFNKWAQDRMQHMTWTSTCKAWYKDTKGKVYVPWPGTVYHYVKTVQLIRWEDFDFVFEDPKQKYTSLGNGVPPEGFAPRVLPWLL